MHPVNVDIDFALERNRLTAFFRLLLAIPWLLWAYVYGLAALIGAVIAWFALMFTGRYPQSLYEFICGFIRYAVRLAAFLALANDSFPPFGGGAQAEYPVRVELAPRQESYSRAKTFFKLLLYIPQALIGSGAQSLVSAAAIIGWFRIVFTGKQSATAHDALLVGLSYSVRATSFLLLVTEIHPRLLDVTPPRYPADTPALLPTAPSQAS